MRSPKTSTGNPLSGIISDEAFHTLQSLGLFNSKTLRDLIIRQKYRELRKKDVPAKQAIQKLREEYGYLQPDTLRKIIYNIK